MRAILLFLFFALPLFGGIQSQHLAAIASSQSGGGGPSLVDEDDAGSNATNWGQSGDLWLASEYIPSQSLTLIQVDVKLDRNSWPGGTVTLEIYSDDAGATPNEPDASLDVSTTILTTNTLTTTQAYVSFEGLSLSLTGSSTYWIVLKHSAAGTGSNYIQSGYTSAAYPDGMLRTGDSGATWTTERSNRFLLKTYE